MGKRYKCPYCDKRDERSNLITHVKRSHKELIPEGFSAERVVYNSVNKVSCGRCRVCGKETPWNQKAGRYDVLCGNPKCKEHMREEYKKNMLRVRGTYNILNDPEQQTKMLANRKISGSYKFSDGGELTYTGSYEKKCLEFMDVVMQIPSKDILSPGPTLEYEYNGKKHFYITDFYYIPYNLIIEVKDGGEDPNTKDSTSMRASREKTIAKEKIITDRGDYNYIRLTNNNFSQLIEIFMDIKLKLLEGDTSKTYKINESAILESSDKSSLDEFIHQKIKSPEDLLRWMKKNISYHNFTRLKSPDELYNSKTGSCHDQSLFVKYVLGKLHIKTGTLFIIECPEKGGAGGETHSLTYFEKNKKLYWFESAWGGNEGIHGPYDSLSELKHAVEDKWNKKAAYPILFMTTVKNTQAGMTLGEFVNACCSDEEIIGESAILEVFSYPCELSSKGTGAIHPMLKIFVEAMRKRYNTKTKNIDIIFLKSYQTLANTIHKYEDTFQFKNDFMVRVKDTIYIVDPVIFTNRNSSTRYYTGDTETYYAVLKWQLCNILLTEYTDISNLRTINAISMYEAGINSDNYILSSAQEKDLNKIKRIADIDGYKSLPAIVANRKSIV